MNKIFVMGNDHNQDVVSTISSHLSKRDMHTNLPDSADIVLVLGGDGTILSAINNYSCLDIPFVGYNMGTLGFLMNEFVDIDPLIHRLERNMFDTVEFSPLIVRAYSEGEQVYIGSAFNDMWVERTTGQTLDMSFSINNLEVAYGVRGDGVLVCTPQGSTAYNKALGGRVVPLGVSAYQITPMAAMKDKKRMDSILVSDDFSFEVYLSQIDKRPARLMMDGKAIDIEGIDRVVISEEEVDPIKLLFEDVNDYEMKIYSAQFLN